jgi:hypothetical protein
MRFIKIIFYFFASLILLTGITGFIIAYYYGDEVKQYVVGELNKKLNTQIAIKDIQFSVFSNFPNASIEFKQVSIKSPNDFQIGQNHVSDTLCVAKSVALLFNIKDIINKNYNVKAFIVEEGKLNIFIDKQGNNNYHFWKDVPADSLNAGFSFKLNKVLINNMQIAYQNLATQQSFTVKVNKALLKGNLIEQNFDLVTDANLYVYNFTSKTVTYLNNKPLKFAVDLSVNNNTYTLRKTNLEIAGLKLAGSGSFAIENKNTNLNLKIKSKNIDIEQLISMLPAQYANSTKNYVGKGNLDFNASIKGNLNSTTLPLIQANFGITEGALKVSKQNINLEKINIKGSFLGGNVEKNTLDIQSLSASLNGKTFTANIKIIDFADPYVNGALKADINLKSLFGLIRPDTVYDADGEIAFDIIFEGKIKNANTESFNNGGFNASGKIKLSDVSFSFNDGSLKLKRVNAELTIKNRDIAINDLNGQIANSDFKIDGVAHNVLAYLSKSEASPNVDLTLYSNKIVIDDFISKKSQAKDTLKKAVLAMIPEGTYQLNVNELKYNKFTAGRIKGTIIVENKGLLANNVSFTALNGLINLQGTMQTVKADSLKIACDAKLQQINLRSLFNEMDNFGQDVLTEKNIDGNLDATVQLVSMSSNKFKLDIDKLYCKTDINIENGQLLDFEPMMALSRFIKVSELKNIRFSTLKNQLEIYNQKIYIPSMEIKSNAINLTASGSHSFNNQVDYKIKVLLSDLLGRKAKDNNTEFGVIEDDGTRKMSLYLTMKDDIKHPKFAYDKASVATKIKSDLKTEKEMLKNILKEEFSIFKNTNTTEKDLNAPNKKEDIQIDTEEDETPLEKPKTLKPESKTQEQRKSMFNNLRKRLSGENPK